MSSFIVCDFIVHLQLIFTKMPKKRLRKNTVGVLPLQPILNDQESNSIELPPPITADEENIENQTHSLNGICFFVITHSF